MQCPKQDCKSTRFKVEHIKPENADYRLCALICTQCGHSLGVYSEDMLNMLLDVHKKVISL
jgi:hypothetical protein